MNAKTLWILVGLVALFAGGVAAGILGYHYAVLPHGGPSTHRHDAASPGDHFRKRLDLTDEQAAEVKGILDGLHKEMEPLAKGFHDKFETLRSQAWTDIRATLSDEQRVEFDRLVEEMEKRHAPH
jgi:ABC-type transporter lipoprotein component MlaA